MTPLYITKLHVFDEYHYKADGRTLISKVYELIYAALVEQAHWITDVLYEQPLTTVGGTAISFPALAFRNFGANDSPDRIIISGIHGTEPASVIALATYATELAAFGKKQKILLIVANPWGYAQNKEYGYTSISVGNFDKMGLGRLDNPASPEAEKMALYLHRTIKKPARVGVLDLHEDPPDEDGMVYVDTHGTYIYVIGYGAENHPVTTKIVELLAHAGVPLLPSGKTRDGDEIVKGKVIGKKDSSIDHLLAEKYHASPVVTLETPTFMPLEKRVAIHQKSMEIFLSMKL